MNYIDLISALLHDSKVIPLINRRVSVSIFCLISKCTLLSNSARKTKLLNNEILLQNKLSPKNMRVIY